MKVAYYSDLHLEYYNEYKLDLSKVDSDIIVLAGDIISLKNKAPLLKICEDVYPKRVFYVLGNHEYYNCHYGVKLSLNVNKPENLIILDDNDYSLEYNIKIFGGTMWTDFNNSALTMMNAAHRINDFKLIKLGRKVLTISNMEQLFGSYKEKLIQFLDSKPEKCIIVSHFSPIKDDRIEFRGSPLNDYFCAECMTKIIEQYQPDLWIYGHTHATKDIMIGKTRIVSNARGYLGKYTWECEDFNIDKIVEI